MLTYLLDPVTLTRLRLKNLRNKVRAIGWEEARDFEFSSHNLLVQVRRLRVFKRQEPADHSVKDDPATPDITLEPKVLLSGDHFRGSVAWGPASRFKKAFGRLVNIAEAEIDNFERLVEVEEQVLGLEVAMADATFMDVFNAGDKLLENTDGSLLVQSLMLDNVIEKFSIDTVFHDQI